MPLTDTSIRAANQSEKQQKLFDGSGLFLLVFSNGSKVWRFKYHFQGREKLISLGAYPVVTLKDARDKAADARKALSNGKDPSAERHFPSCNTKTPSRFLPVRGMKSKPRHGRRIMQATSCAAWKTTSSHTSAQNPWELSRLRSFWPCCIA